NRKRKVAVSKTAGKRSFALYDAAWENFMSAVSPSTHVSDALPKKPWCFLPTPCSVFTGMPTRLLMLLFTEQDISTINMAAANAASYRKCVFVIFGNVLPINLQSYVYLIRGARKNVSFQILSIPSPMQWGNLSLKRP